MDNQPPFLGNITAESLWGGLGPVAPHLRSGFALKCHQETNKDISFNGMLRTWDALNSKTYSYLRLGLPTPPSPQPPTKRELLTKVVRRDTRSMVML